MNEPVCHDPSIGCDGCDGLDKTLANSCGGQLAENPDVLALHSPALGRRGRAARSYQERARGGMQFDRVYGIQPRDGLAWEAMRRFQITYQMP